jgi:hypothetical protein
VRPATVLRWHREAWRHWWRFRSRRRVGRPPIDAELRDLIRRMWRENRLLGGEPDRRRAREARLTGLALREIPPKSPAPWPRSVLEHLSPEPCLAGLGLRLLHGGHRPLPDPLRVRRHLPRGFLRRTADRERLDGGRASPFRRFSRAACSRREGRLSEARRA